MANFDSKLFSLATSAEWDSLLSVLAKLPNAPEVIMIENKENESILKEVIKNCTVSFFVSFLYLPNLYNSILNNQSFLNDLLTSIKINKNKVLASWKALSVLEFELKQNQYKLPVRIYKKFSFLKAKDIIPFPQKIYDLLQVCVKELAKPELLNWLQNTNPFCGSLEDLPIPDQSELVIYKLSDLHISIDTPDKQHSDSIFTVELSHLSVYPLGKSKIGTVFTKTSNGSKFCPMAWCTIRANIPDCEDKIMPRDHAYFHISFAQIGFIQ